MELVDEIKKAMELAEIRSSEDPDKYFEAVFRAKDLDTLLSLLRKNIGESLKSPGKGVRFSKDIDELVDNMGGLRPEQSFYFRQEANGEYIYAALWPWQSDPSQITLKIGKGCFVQRVRTNGN